MFLVEKRATQEDRKYLRPPVLIPFFSTGIRKLMDELLDFRAPFQRISTRKNGG